MKNFLLLILISCLALGQELNVKLLDNYQTGIWDDGAVEISAYEANTQRLFVLNASEKKIIIFDISNPEDISLFGEIDITTYGGNANSIAAFSGVVAVAVENDNKQSPGVIVYFEADGTYIDQDFAGSLPDMLTFSNNGDYLIVCNEGEPNDNYDNDPEGSITLVDFTDGFEQRIVTQIDFNKYDTRKEQLKNSGVRIFGPNASVSQDLEPEYAAFSDDDTFAYVSCQENNAMAVLEIATQEVIDILPLGFKANSFGSTSLEQIPLNLAVESWPILGIPLYENSEPVMLGGFSGLWFSFLESDQQTQKLVAYTVPDRGPNDATLANESGPNFRPFKLPDYQARIVRIELSGLEQSIELTDQIMLYRKDGVTPISGRGNIPGFDEIPVTYLDNEVYTTADFTSDGTDLAALPYDLYGADFEGIVQDVSGNFWLCDEYRPSIYGFTADGVMIERFVPVGTGQLGEEPHFDGKYGAETLPANYSYRRANRGFEGIAYAPEKNLIYAFIQSPIENPGSTEVRNNSDVIRILGINPQSGTPVEEYVYLLNRNRDSGKSLSRVDKIGDAVYMGNGRFGIIERDSDFNSEEAQKFVYMIDINKATNILDLPIARKFESTGPDDKTLEMMTADEIIEAGINPAFKIKLFNLPSIGYSPSDKPEGLAFAGNTFNPSADEYGSGAFMVLNDNDFGLAGAGNTDNSVLGIINFNGDYAFDASNDDGDYFPVPWPTFGMYQPDAIANYVSNDKNYFVTANEGDSRDYDGYSEEDRVADLDLNSDYNYEEDIQDDEELGRLNITRANGDLDGDGVYEYIFNYGGRSFAIFDEYGNLVYDSGSEFEVTIADLYPDDFNSNQTNDSYDSRSDDKGCEPEGIAVGKVAGQTYAFIGLERMGGFMIYDITDIDDVFYVDYIMPRDFSIEPIDEDNPTSDEIEALGDIGPEGMEFIPASQSPNGVPLLIVSNEITGSLSIYQVGEPSSVRSQNISESFIEYVGPNPFLDKSKIVFNVSKNALVTIEVHDINGNKIISDSRNYSAGLRGFNINGKSFAPGVYVATITIGDKTESIKLIKK
jgi:hypothetical protein